MEIKGIKYVGPILDNSGYAKACRQNILALHSLGIPLTLHPISFEHSHPDLGKDGVLINSLLDNRVDYNIVLCHTTPEFWHKYKEAGKTMVGFTIWETTKLHPYWKDYINNNADACLVGCNWNIDIFKDSGVKVPLFNVPHSVSPLWLKNSKPLDVAGVKDDAFIFYNIFQFTERKHPIALIKAYWYTFRASDNVALVLKTYRSDYSEPEKDAIRATISRFKKTMPMVDYPPIYLVLDMLSEEEIAGLHARGDCCISLDRGEGFGLTPFQAGAVGNPIIVTGFAGVTEYAKPDNSYLVDYSLTPVSGMPWCMSLNSLVKTEYGYDRARNLKENIFVYNKNLKHMSINKVEFRPLLDDEEIYSLKSFSSPEEIEVTNEHKLYIVEGNKPTKRKVSEINVGDYLFVPKPTTTMHIPKLCDAIKYEKMPDLFYLFGLYAAEGYIDKNNRFVSFSFSLDEKITLGSRCKDIMKSIFDDKIEHIYERDLTDRNGYEITFYGSELVKVFNWHFMTGSHKKHISDDLKYHSLNYELIKGYWDGDGHIRKEGYKNKKSGKHRISPECVAETASLNLCMDIRDILLALGIVPSLRKSIRKDGRESYIISISNSIFDEILGVEANRIGSKYSFDVPGGFGVLVTKKELMEEYDDLICSISVRPDDDEDVECGGSYILNGVASSNSPWYMGDQLWAEPDVYHASRLMRHVYENQAEAKEKGLKLQSYIKENFSYGIIGNKIIDAIRKL